MPEGGDPSTPDSELRDYDVAMMLRYGLSRGGAHRTALFGDGAVAAALQAEELGVLPRSSAFLGEVVRRGGVVPATRLPEPLPGDGPARLAHDWLVAAASVVPDGDPAADETVARWWEAVAAVQGTRRASRRGEAP